MLDAWIIDRIEREREQEEDSVQIPLELPLPISEPIPFGEATSPEADRGVVVIDFYPVS